MIKLRSLLTRLRRDEDGAAIIELAFIAPILATMTIGVIDISTAYGRKLALEQAAQRAIEKIMNTTADDTVEATLQEEAATQANVPTSQVEVEVRVECDGSVSSTGDCATGQTMSQWISVTVNDSYEPMFNVSYVGLGGDGAYDMSGEAGIRVQ